jgi:putative oxidoreductase
MNRTVRDVLIGGSEPRPAADLGFTVLRIFAGLSLALAHGWGKLAGADARAGLAGMIETMGAPAPQATVWLVVIAEFFCGILLAAGLLTRLAALLICGNMLVAAVGWHMLTAKDPYNDAELALLFAAVAFAFILAGGGRFSVDRLLRR